MQKMKKNFFRLFAFLFIGVLLIGCSKSSSDPSPVDVATTNLVRTWRLDVPSITIQGIPISTLLPTAPQVYAPLRFAINANGTYSVTGAELAGVSPTGTWAFDGTNTGKIILNPGNVGATISNLTNTTMTIGYTFPTVGSIYAALGSNAAVSAKLVSP
jgi:hypothetical protein